MKKVLLFTDSLGSGGAQRQLVGLAVMLHEAGFDTKVCTYYNLDFYKGALDKSQVPNELIPGADIPRKRIWAVRSYFKKENPDWIVAYQETPSLVALMAKLLGLKFRLITSERNTTQHLTIAARIRFFLYHWSDMIVPNSYTQEGFLIAHYPWMKSKLTTISNFVDLDRFPFVSKQRTSKRPLIVVAATVWQSKNTLGMIEAAKILKEKKQDFLIEWYGVVSHYQDYVDQCLALIQSYGLQDQFKLLPKTQQIQQKYQECDFFCLPSFYEGTPNVIAESMASGCPVLCSNVCDNGIYVKEGENGFLFDPNDPENIANTFQKAFALTDEDYMMMCEQSRFKAEHLLSKDIFLEKYCQIIR